MDYDTALRKQKKTPFRILLTLTMWLVFLFLNIKIVKHFYYLREQDNVL